MFVNDESVDVQVAALRMMTRCDDADPDNFPGNPEVCDGQDNDCDGDVDDDDGDIPDGDNDGQGSDQAAAVAACVAPAQHVAGDDGHRGRGQGRAQGRGHLVDQALAFDPGLADARLDLPAPAPNPRQQRLHRP